MVSYNVFIYFFDIIKESSPFRLEKVAPQQIVGCCLWLQITCTQRIKEITKIMFEFMFIQMRQTHSESCQYLQPNRIVVPNLSQCNSQIKLYKELLKVLRDVVFVIFISRLFHSFITLRKKEFIKYSVLQLKDGIF